MSTFDHDLQLVECIGMLPGLECQEDPDVILVCDEQNQIDTEEAQFLRLADEGREPLAAVMSFMLSNWTQRALEVIGRGNNWRAIAYALAVMFHNADGVPLRVKKARGFDRLRGMVTTCIYDLHLEDRQLPASYERLAQRLFASRGHARS